MNKMLAGFAGFAGLVIGMMPVGLAGQGIRVTSVIPTQSLVQRAAALTHLTPSTRAVVAVTPRAEVACNMLVAKPAPGTSATDAGGIAQPPDRAVPILTARAECVDRMADPAPDHDLLKKQ
jgi:hypothetical protein